MTSSSSSIELKIQIVSELVKHSVAPVVRHKPANAILFALLRNSTCHRQRQNKGLSPF